jgi:hypothetical protein
MIVIGEALQLLSDFDIATDVRFGVKSGHFAKSLVYLVGACEERGRHGKIALAVLRLRTSSILSTRTFHQSIVLVERSNVGVLDDF